MAERDVYDWIHKKQAPKVQRMGMGELLINYLIRRNSGADKLNYGPSNLMNILINDRLEDLGLDKSVLDAMSEKEIRGLAQLNLEK